MKAAVYRQYGAPDVVRIQQLPKPVPKDNELLVSIHATTLCAADWRLRKADPFLIRFMIGLAKPAKVNVLGMEFAGTVESVGAAVTQFRADDRVFGGTGFKFGCHAEYTCVPVEGTVATQPVNMTHEEAAAVGPGAIEIGAGPAPLAQHFPHLPALASKMLPKQQMKLLVQPGDGVSPLVEAINDAKKSVEVLIFRFDRVEIENALVKAVARGVAVRALIAYTNRGGEKNLRALEMRLLAAGVTVARTDDDLIRYHGKMMIVDARDLYLMGFNFTNLDIERSRSFGVVTDETKIVKQAIELFDADCKRVPYAAEMDAFVISPLNARKVLSDFIKAAKEELLIWDPAVTDPSMVRILAERSKAGVKIRVLGKLSRRVAGAEARPLFMRLHSRTIVRDGEKVFLGSQSLRTEELDARREVGLIFHEPKISAKLTGIFDEDWKESVNAKEGKAKQKDSDADEPPPSHKVAKKVAKTVAKNLPDVAPVLEVVVREMGGSGREVGVDPEELQATVKDAVKTAIQEVVAGAVEQAAKVGK